jgi:hypothetical protein
MQNPGKASVSIVAIVIAALFGCKGKSMPWTKRQIPDIAHLRTNCLLLTKDGSGYCGGSIFSDASSMELNPRKALSLDSSVLYETRNDWQDRRQVFKGSGEIVALFRTGSEGAVAQNIRNDATDYHESVHFLVRKLEDWQEVSKLELRGSRVWGSEGQWLLAAGYPELANDPVSKYVSADGGMNWHAATLAGYNPLAGGRDKPLFLNPDGVFFRVEKRRLEKLDLNRMDGSAAWEAYGEMPVNFQPLALTGTQKVIWAFGSTSDKKFGLVRFGDGVATAKEARGLPEGFLCKTFTLSGNSFHLAGALELKRGAETVGFKKLILESKNQGDSWSDLELPINGSLEAYDFGADGRIWAVAAGNRMQVLVR